MDIAQNNSTTDNRLLVCNCHEAWVYQLAALPFGLDIISDLPGRPIAGWDARMRPVPANGRLITLAQAKQEQGRYHCLIGHSVSDLLDLKEIPGPRIMVVHNTLDGRLAMEDPGVSRVELLATIQDYCQLMEVQIVPVSPLKATSWGFPTAGDSIVKVTADPTAYIPFSGELARGIRVANQVTRKKKILLWDFHEQACQGLPITLIGHNPDLPGVRAARDWAELKENLRCHRFYIHTADPQFEDGYNMAMLEAMAAGLPVLCNTHPSSPVIHGVNGFVADNPATLRGYAEQLLGNRDLAIRLGAAAKQLIVEKFSPSKFCHDMTRRIEAARARNQRN